MFLAYRSPGKLFVEFEKTKIPATNKSRRAGKMQVLVAEPFRRIWAIEGKNWRLHEANDAHHHALFSHRHHSRRWPHSSNQKGAMVSLLR
jgi:hypothetical protein